jgi:hypothetical protein
LEKLATLVSLPRFHLVRYGGCLAPYSRLRSTITPTPRQQGKEGDEATPESPRWSWTRLLKQVFTLDMAPCPLCHQGSLRDRRQHPGRGDPADALASEARGRPAADCPCPCSPRYVRLGCLSRCAEAHGRWARSGDVCHPVEHAAFP